MWSCIMLMRIYQTESQQAHENVPFICICICICIWIWIWICICVCLLYPVSGMRCVGSAKCQRVGYAILCIYIDNIQTSSVHWPVSLLLSW